MTDSHEPLLDSQEVISTKTAVDPSQSLKPTSRLYLHNVTSTPHGRNRPRQWLTSPSQHRPPQHFSHGHRLFPFTLRTWEFPGDLSKAEVCECLLAFRRGNEPPGAVKGGSVVAPVTDTDTDTRWCLSPEAAGGFRGRKGALLLTTRLAWPPMRSQPSVKRLGRTGGDRGPPWGRIMGSSFPHTHYPHLLLSSQIRILNRITESQLELILHVIQSAVACSSKEGKQTEGLILLLKMPLRAFLLK